jgi:hypothetical protein
VILAAALVLLGGAIGFGRGAPVRSPRWAALTAILGAALALLGALLPWLYDESMSYQVDAPLEGAVWVAVVVACVSAGVQIVLGARSPLAPAVPLLAAGSFLVGAFVVGWNAAVDNDYPMQIGFFLLGAGAVASTMVAAVLAARVPADVSSAPR